MNALSQFGRRPVGVLITIFLTPFILNHLGSEVYGVWALTGSLLAYTGFLAFGLNSAVTYRVPRFLAANDIRGVNRVLSTVFFFYCLGAGLTLVSGLLLAWKFPVWFQVPLPLHDPARIVVGLLAFNIAVDMPLTVYKGVISSLQRWDVIAGVSIASQLLRAAGIVVTFSLGFGLVALAAVSVAASLGATFILTQYAKKLHPNLRVERQYVTWSMLPELMRYSLNTLMYSASQIIMLQSGKTLIGLLYGPTAVTIFTIPFTLLIMLSQMVHQAAQTLRPATTMLDGEGRRDTIGRIYVLATKYSLLVAVPVCVLFLLWGENLLKVWIGEEFSVQSAAVLSIMTIPQMLRAVNSSGFFVLSGLGQHRFFGQVTLVQSLLGIALGYVLAKPLGLGLIGVVAGIAAMELIISGTIVPLHVVRLLRCDLSQLRLGALRAGAASVPCAIFYLAAPIFFTSGSRLELLGVLALSVLPFALGFWFIGLSRVERKRFAGYLRSARADGRSNREGAGI